MKLVLKILALPVLFVVKVICILGNLLTNIVSYVIGILLLVIGGSAIYCIVKALWQSLLILVVLGIVTIVAVFLLVWAVMKVENSTINILKTNIHTIKPSMQLIIPDIHSAGCIFRVFRVIIEITIPINEHNGPQNMTSI